MGKGTKSLFYVTGGKGGVGKSMVAIALIDYLLFKRQVSVGLVESDLTNPDVAKINEDIVHKFECLDLDVAEGWIGLANCCERWSEQQIVVNTGARNLHGVKRHGPIVQELSTIGRNFVTLWTINTQLDSLELLHDYREAMWNDEAERPIGKIHVVCNSGVNYEENFGRYDRSDVAKKISAEGGKVVIFPTLAKLVADELFSERIAISEARNAIPYGNWAMLTRWRRHVWAAFAELLQAEF